MTLSSWNWWWKSLKRETSWLSGEKSVEKTHWRQEGRLSFHLTSHKQNTLCLLHKSCNKRGGDRQTDSAEMMELYSGTVRQTCSVLSPVTFWCWETSAPGMHVASLTASYLLVWSWCQTHSVHTPGYTSCGVKPNVSSQCFARLLITPTQKGTTFETYSIKMSLKMSADLLPAERSECLVLKGT